MVRMILGCAGPRWASSFLPADPAARVLKASLAEFLAPLEDQEQEALEEERVAVLAAGDSVAEEAGLAAAAVDSADRAGPGATVRMAGTEG